MSDLHNSADERRRDYIVGALREAGSMYEGDARAYLAEHDAAHQAETLAELDRVRAERDRLRVALAPTEFVPESHCVCREDPAAGPAHSGHEAWCPARKPTPERITELRQGIGEEVTRDELDWLRGAAGRHELHVTGSRDGDWPLRDLPGAVVLLAQYLDAAVAALGRVLPEETAATEKASATAPTATPKYASDPPYDVLDGEISILGSPPITLSGWHYTELAPDFYGHAYMQIGGWLPEGWPSEDTPAGTQRMAYAHLHGRALPRDINVQMETKGYGEPRRFLKIQWRKFTSEPEPVLSARQERLLAEMRRADTPEVWSTGPVEELYRTWHVRTPRHEARRDLAQLAELGHLTRHGDDTGRRYRLNTQKDGDR